MHNDTEERSRRVGQWILENKATVRAAASHFGVSKSTVHLDVTRKLEQLDRLLYLQVRQVLELNKAERHIRGGDATRRKYKGQSSQAKV